MRTSEPLLRLPAFPGVDRREAALLLRHTDLVSCPAGQSVLLSPGPAQELLIVLDGQLVALEPTRWVAGPGSILGTQALLNRVPQPVGFRARGAALLGARST